MSWRELTLPVLAVAFTAYVIYGMLERLPLSAELTDEALTAALPYRFILGDRPFIDEINSAQTATFILIPFVWLYLKVVHSTTGIILFMRMLFLVGKLALSAAVFATVKRHIAWPLALVASLVCVVFVPYSIASPSYNVLGSGFLTACCFIAARRYLPGGTAGDMWWAGICGGLAALAYPPLGLPVVILGFVVLGLRGDTRSRLRDFGSYVAGGLLVAVVVAPVFVRGGRANLEVMIEYGALLAPKAPSKLFDTILALWTHAPISFWVVPTLVMVRAGLTAHPRWSIWVLPLLVASLSLGVPSALGSQLPIVIYAALLAPAFLVFLWDDPFCRALFGLVWVPSFVAGLVTSYTSSNGELNAAIGFFPAAALFVVYEAIAVVRLSRDPGDSRDSADSTSASPLMLLGPAVITLSMLARYSHTVYRDGPIQDLEVRVESGPFRGLFTTKERALLLVELEQIFRRHEDPRGRVLVYWESPAGYLFSRMQPAPNTVWPIPGADQNALMTHYRQRITGHGFSIKVKGSSRVPVTPLDEYLQETGRPLENTDHFVVLGEPAP